MNDRYDHNISVYLSYLLYTHGYDVSRYDLHIVKWTSVVGNLPITNMSSSSGALPATNQRPGTTFAPLEKAKYLAQDLHILSNGGGRPSSAGPTSTKQPTERRVHTSKLDYVREMLQLERENRKRDQKIIERQAKTIVMLTDHVERVISAIRSYVEIKLMNDGKMRDLRTSIQRLRTVIDKQQLSITVHQQLIASSKGMMT